MLITGVNQTDNINLVLTFFCLSALAPQITTGTRNKIVSEGLWREVTHLSETKRLVKLM